MQTRPPLTSFLALGVFMLGALATRPAAADTSCNADSDCLKGWSCQVTGGTGCGYACPSGQECAPPPDCAPTETKACRPGPCVADSDCASGMVCYTSTSTNCSAVSCPAGATCPQPTCATTSQSACVPRYLLPCKTAADCGAGFDCTETKTNCACASSAGSSGPNGAAGGAATPPAPAPDCMCEGSSVNVCVAKPVSCTSSAQCASGWSCQALGPTLDCAATTPPPDPNGSAGGPPVPNSDPCTPSTPTMLCLPPYYAEAGVAEDSGAVPTPTGGVGDKTAGLPDPRGAVPSSGNGAAATTSTAGCTVAFGSRSSGAAGALFAFGLFAVLRRRRSLTATR